MKFIWQMARASAVQEGVSCYVRRGGLWNNRSLSESIRVEVVVGQETAKLNLNRQDLLFCDDVNYIMEICLM